jgi:hypothetical protein
MLVGPLVTRGLFPKQKTAGINHAFFNQQQSIIGFIIGGAS